MADSFLDDLQIDELQGTGFHLLTEDELNDMNIEDIDEDMNIVHKFNTREIHVPFWSDFHHINEDDIPF